MLWAETRGGFSGWVVAARRFTHLGTPILALLGMQSPWLVLVCLSFCSSHAGSLHVSGGPVRKVDCISLSNSHIYNRSSSVSLKISVKHVN